MKKVVAKRSRRRKGRKGKGVGDKSRVCICQSVSAVSFLTTH